MMQDRWRSLHSASLGTTPKISRSAPCSPIKPISPKTHSDPFHVSHKVPAGDTPYVRAKRVQLVDKDPEKAIALFWAAINAGDRVDSALKDMAIVMKQQNRADEAIEAIRSLRSCCSDQAQESLDNILLDLYKRCGRLGDQILLLKHKLNLIQQGLAFNGKRTKTARSQGRKFQVSLEQEATRLLGNLGWSLMQKEDYVEAEAAYRQALLIGPDNNKMCNLGICLMKQGRIAEAKETLKQVKRPVASDGSRGGGDSHLKAFERAQEMLRDLENSKKMFEMVGGGGGYGGIDLLLQGCTGSIYSSSIWQPQPCIDYNPPPLIPPRPSRRELFADENLNTSNIISATTSREAGAKNPSLNIDALPFFYSTSTFTTNSNYSAFSDALGNLKRTRSGNLMDKPAAAEAVGNQRRSSLPLPELPDDDAFNEAMLAAVLGSAGVPDNGGGDSKFATKTTMTTTASSPLQAEGKMGKRLRVFQDITP